MYRYMIYIGQFHRKCQLPTKTWVDRVKVFQIGPNKSSLSFELESKFTYYFIDSSTLLTFFLFQAPLKTLGDWNHDNTTGPDRPQINWRMFCPKSCRLMLRQRISKVEVSGQLGVLRDVSKRFKTCDFWLQGFRTSQLGWAGLGKAESRWLSFWGWNKANIYGWPISITWGDALSKMS